MRSTTYGKLEAWSLIGRIGHQNADWYTVMTPAMLENALKDHGIPREVIDILWVPETHADKARSLKPYRDTVISRRACVLVRDILRELEEFPEMSILDTMQFAQERKIAMR